MLFVLLNRMIIGLKLTSRRKRIKTAVLVLQWIVTIRLKLTSRRKRIKTISSADHSLTTTSRLKLTSRRKRIKTSLKMFTGSARQGLKLTSGYSLNSNLKNMLPFQGARYFEVIINPERCSGLTNPALSGRKQLKNTRVRPEGAIYISPMATPWVTMHDE